MARKSLHEKIFSKSPAERTVGEVALCSGDYSLLPEFEEGGDTKEPITVNNSIRGEWNNYVNWLGTTGKKGSLDLDKDGLGFQMLDQYRKVNPKTILTKDYVFPIQQDFQKYRNWAIDQHKAGKLKVSGDPGTNYENFMPELSIEDGYPGSKTTSHVFPSAYLQYTDELGKTTTMNKGFAASSVAKMKEGGSLLGDGSVDQSALMEAGLGLLPAALTMFDPNATAASKGSGIGGGIGGVAGTLLGGPVGGAIGSTLGSFIGGKIAGNPEAKLKEKRYNEVTQRKFGKWDPVYNANAYGDNNSFYAEEGGQPDKSATQQPAMTKVNIEKGELAVNPVNFEITRKFTNKNRYASHAENSFMEPVGNHITLPDDNIIIPKKLAKTYENGSNVTRRSIIAQLLKDQVNREHAEGAEKQFADGGKPYILQSAANTEYPIAYPDFTGGYEEPAMGSTLQDVAVKTVRKPVDEIVYDETPPPTNTDYGFKLPKIKVPHVSGVGAAQVLNLAPTAYGIANAFSEDPFLQYHENNGFAGAKSDIEQIPTDVNIEGAKAAMNKVNRSYIRQLNNVNSPSIRAENASNYAKVLDATGQLYANSDNERKNRIASKLGQLSNLKVQQGADQEQAQERYSNELRADSANRSNLIQHGLSEGATNIAKQVMDKERIKSLNAMSRYFKLDPNGKQLVEEKPDAVQHIIDQLEAGYIPNFAVTPPATKGKTSSISKKLKTK